VSGTRAKPVEPEGVEHRRTERVTGRFHRRFSLPDTVDSEAVTARNSNGVL
ncbi:Hsp20/alpha crystallin family protein, partial [Vibrio parahaemolyticus]